MKIFNIKGTEYVSLREFYQETHKESASNGRCISFYKRICSNCGIKAEEPALAYLNVDGSNKLSINSIVTKKAMEELLSVSLLACSIEPVNEGTDAKEYPDTTQPAEAPQSERQSPCETNPDVDWKAKYKDMLEKYGQAVSFMNMVSASDDSINIGTLATILQQNDIRIGERALFKWMHENGFLFNSADGYERNIPTEKAVVQGLMTVREVVINGSGSNPHLSFTPKVTGKGQVYFCNLFKEAQNCGNI